MISPKQSQMCLVVASTRCLRHFYNDRFMDFPGRTGTASRMNKVDVRGVCLAVRNAVQTGHAWLQEPAAEGPSAKHPRLLWHAAERHSQDAPVAQGSDACTIHPFYIW